MALTKNFKTVVEVKGVLEGPTKAFSVEFDNVEEWKAAVKTKVETERSPAANSSDF